MNKFLLVFVLLVVASCGGASAAALEVSEDVFRDALIRLSQTNQLDPSTLPLQIDRPAERVANLGLLVDRDDPDGLLVLGTLPGGSAEAIGLIAGDQLIEANGLSLRGNGAGDRLQQLVQLWDSDDELEFVLLRGGRQLRLSGALEVFDLPALRVEIGAEGSTSTTSVSSSCGRVSAFSGAPRGRDLFPVRIFSIDGQSPGTLDQETFRVNPGQVTVVLAERIDRRHFSTVSERRRALRIDDRYRELVLEVEAGSTYYLAARFLGDRGERIEGGAYWEPVLWRVRPELCR